jgi:ring-1,2-phenylacetyl-CoA epoxidase subunit PaaD
MVMAAASATLVEQAWAVLRDVPDPEIPVISLVDLGIIRHVREQGAGVEIGVSPTYSGCPATEVIRQQILASMARAGIEARIVDVLSPPWSSDWISEAGSRALRRYGIAPPRPLRSAAHELPPACPRCESTRTQKVSEFGSTPCKSSYRCLACLEPFELFKCI